MAIDTFSGMPIIGWSIDSLETVEEAVRENLSGGYRPQTLTAIVENFKRNSYDKIIEPLFTKAAFALNLGGMSVKQRIITTDNPNGIFNFSLASQGLYVLKEYFSERLAQEQPDKFKHLDLHSGIVPPNMVKEVNVQGEKRYYYIDDVTGVEYLCVLQDKGTAEIAAGIPGAKKEFASKTKKVYQTYKKATGRVRYVEIYSLFYYSIFTSDAMFAIRHIPAIMVSEYLESIGIMTRFYMTRFVKIGSNVNLRQRDLTDSFELPMGNTPLGRRFDEYLVFQPILAKDYQLEFDRAYAFNISSKSSTEIYADCLYYAYKQELVNWEGRPTGGTPDWSQDDYWEGMERYRNKYKQYVDLGIFKAKEVVPEAMIFFHDYSIRENLEYFISEIQNWGSKKKYGNNTTELLIRPEVNIFFVWWMRASANTIKHKVNLLNTKNLPLEFIAIDKDLSDSIDELGQIVKKENDDKLKSIFEEYGNRIINTLVLNNTKLYVQTILNEIQVVAEGLMYATDEEEIEKKEDFKERVLEKLSTVFP